MVKKRKSSKFSQLGQLIVRFPARLLIMLVRLYQLTLSPYLGRQCKFIPTCSEFFIEAVENHGAAKGSWLGICRICRCHPFSCGGFDPVP